jgi:hypothetical protein
MLGSKRFWKDQPMSGELLDTPIEPAPQALAARLTLAWVDRDADRIEQGLQEVVEGGMPAALP